MADQDKAFVGPIPSVYDALLVPLLFAPYAADLVDRLGRQPVSRVLELAAGTGVVTRRLADALPAQVDIVATDLNVAMLELAQQRGTPRPVEWRQADAMALPFPDASFDAVVCQFGVMFFPDKARAFAEARRALKPGGWLLFNTWDRISENEFTDTVMQALASVFPDDPPSFMTRVPHGYHDRATILRDLALAGFTKPARFDTVTAYSSADTAAVPAVALCQGTPVRHEIETRDAGRLDEATDAATRALAARFGNARVKGKIQAHVICVET